MPFLLIAALVIAVVASPLAAADAAPPRELSQHAGARAVPIAPGGGITALRTTAAAQRVSTGQPARRDGVVPAAGSSKPTSFSGDMAPAQPLQSDGLIPLSPKSPKPAGDLGQADVVPSSDEQRARGRSTWIATTVGALGIALGVFLMLAWMVRRSVPAGLRPLPADVVEVLGRAPLVGRQQLHLLRFANKLVLISTTASGETITVAEIEDRDEVNRVVALCRRHESSSSSESFRRLLQQFGQEPDNSRFADDSGAGSNAAPTRSPRERSERGTM